MELFSAVFLAPPHDLFSRTGRKRQNFNFRGVGGCVFVDVTFSLLLLPTSPRPLTFYIRRANDLRFSLTSGHTHKRPSRGASYLMQSSTSKIAVLGPPDFPPLTVLKNLPAGTEVGSCVEKRFTELLQLLT